MKSSSLRFSLRGRSSSKQSSGKFGRSDAAGSANVWCLDRLDINNDRCCFFVNDSKKS
jgi:hypothetical protein